MERRYNFWVYIEQDQGDPSTWVAHCLDLDIISWGSSPSEAKDMVEEAVEACIEDDLNNGLDPLGRSRAPAEEWEKLRLLQGTGRPVDISHRDVAVREQVTKFATMISYCFVAQESSNQPHPHARPLGGVGLPTFGAGAAA